jgi:hypothetical protein
MLTSSKVLPHDNERPYTEFPTRALLELFIWELFDHSLNDYHHLFTYLKNSLRSQRLNNDELEGV